MFASLRLEAINTDGYPAQHTSGNKKAEEDAKKETDNLLVEIRRVGETGGNKVVDDLLRIVTDVKPQVPSQVTALPRS
jgi:V-type H+-transporting ATPase subunit G